MIVIVNEEIISLQRGNNSPHKKWLTHPLGRLVGLLATSSQMEDGRFSTAYEGLRCLKYSGQGKQHGKTLYQA